MTFDQIGLKQINLDYELPMDRLIEPGLGRLNVYDSNNNLVASIPAADAAIEIENNQ
jgi:hypothetical protein